MLTTKKWARLLEHTVHIMLGVDARERPVRRQPRRGGEVRRCIRRTGQGNHIDLSRQRS